MSPAAVLASDRSSTTVKSTPGSVHACVQPHVSYSHAYFLDMSMYIKVKLNYYLESFNKNKTSQSLL